MKKDVFSRIVDIFVFSPSLIISGAIINIIIGLNNLAYYSFFTGIFKPTNTTDLENINSFDIQFVQNSLYINIVFFFLINFSCIIFKKVNILDYLLSLKSSSNLAIIAELCKIFIYIILTLIIFK
jgi:hypothetical protein